MIGDFIAWYRNEDRLVDKAGTIAFSEACGGPVPAWRQFQRDVYHASEAIGAHPENWWYKVGVKECEKRIRRNVKRDNSSGLFDVREKQNA